MRGAGALLTALEQPQAPGLQCLAVTLVPLLLGTSRASTEAGTSNKAVARFIYRASVRVHQVRAAAWAEVAAGPELAGMPLCASLGLAPEGREPAGADRCLPPSFGRALLVMAAPLQRLRAAGLRAGQVAREMLRSRGPHIFRRQGAAPFRFQHHTGHGSWLCQSLRDTPVLQCSLLQWFFLSNHQTSS